MGLRRHEGFGTCWRVRWCWGTVEDGASNAQFSKLWVTVNYINDMLVQETAAVAEHMEENWAFFETKVCDKL